jgi:protein ImuB
MKRIACIRLPRKDCKLKNANCKLQIDEPSESICNLQFSIGNLQCLIEYCRRFSPVVGLKSTDQESLLLDITGLGHLFGGESGWAETIVRDLARRGLSIHVAIADTIGAAWAAAHYGKSEINNYRLKTKNCNPPPSAFPLPPSPFLIIPAGETPVFLAPLPIEALCLPAEIVRLLHELGITRIGQLEALPRAELSSRFGPALLMQMDRAFGRFEEPVPACPDRPTFTAEWSAEHPTSRRETIEAVLEHLTGQVAARLARYGRGALQLECRLVLEIPNLKSQISNPKSQISNLKSQISNPSLSVGLFQPTAAAGHLFPLVRLQLERLHIAAPVISVRVAATLTAPLEPRRQTMLFDLAADGQSRRHMPCAGAAHGVCGPHFGSLVERLSSRLGRGAVVGVRLRPEAQPELSWHYDPLVERRRRRRPPTPLPAELPPRPLRLLPRPLPLGVMWLVPGGPPLRFHYAGRQQHVAQSWGPERIETGWWRGRPVGRDYFRVETAAGCHFWLFRRLRDEKWFLHGTFD